MINTMLNSELFTNQDQLHKHLQGIQNNHKMLTVEEAFLIYTLSLQIES